MVCTERTGYIGQGKVLSSFVAQGIVYLIEKWVKYIYNHRTTPEYFAIIRQIYTSFGRKEKMKLD